MKLELDVNAAQADKTLNYGTEGGAVLLVTPPIGEDYWMFRVKLSSEQAILGFPKFMTIGIGFAKETDWNTNLPYTCDTEEIFQHIKHNKGTGNIKDGDCREAIRMVQAAATLWRKHGDAVQV